MSRVQSTAWQEGTRPQGTWIELILNLSVLFVSNVEHVQLDIWVWVLDTSHSIGWTIEIRVVCSSMACDYSGSVSSCASVQKPCQMLAARSCISSARLCTSIWAPIYQMQQLIIILTSRICSELELPTELIQIHPNAHLLRQIPPTHASKCPPQGIIQIRALIVRHPHHPL